MGTRARLFAQGLGGGAGSSPSGNAATIAAILPFLTTANVSELTPNLYYSNARTFANIELASLNDFKDVTFYSNVGADLRQNNYGLVWNASSNIWQPGPVTASLSGFTTDDLVEGSNNLYYTNNRSRFAIFAGDNTITYNPYTGEIRANVQQIANAGSNTTDGLPEGTQNLYFTNARVLANIQGLSVFDLRDVNDPQSVFTGSILKWNGTAFTPVDPQDLTTNLAVRANTVNTLYGFTTDDLAEGANNYYLTTNRLTNLLANLSIEAFGDVKNASSKVTGHVLTWSGTEWQAQAPANVAGVGSASFAETSNVANVALSAVVAANANFATTARTSQFTSNATYANVAGFTAFTLLANVANVALFTAVAGTANTALTALFANVAGQVNSLANFTTNDLAEGNLRLYYTDARVFSNVSQMYLDTLYNVSVSTANTDDVLKFDGTNWVPGTSVGNALRANFADVANVANLVISISNHTTDELPEGANNQYYTTARLANDIQAAIYGKDIELDDLTLFGDLTVQGNVATLNVSNIISQAKTLILGKDGGAEGVGISIPSANATITYGGTNDGFGFNKDLTIAGNILPAIDSRFNLGSPSKLWRGLYIGARTIYLGNTTIGGSPSGGLVVQDQYGNPAGIELSNIAATQYVVVNRILGNVTPETEFSGYFGGNVAQFTSNVTGNIYFGILKDGDFNKFAGMRVQELRDTSGVVRSDLVFYNDREAFSNSRAALALTGNANAEFLGNVIKINNIEVIDWRGNFVGNVYAGRDVDITRGGTGANTTQNARRNLFGDMTGGLVAKIVGSNTLAPVSILAGTGVVIADGDAQSGSPTISIGQNVATTASVTFENVTISRNLAVYGNVTTYGANNLSISDNMIYLNHGANSAPNPDIGVVWAFVPAANGYQHGGIFRDATDGRIKFFEGYTPEPDANVFINTDHASFRFANIQATSFIGNVVGVVSSLDNLTTDSLKEGSSNLYFTSARALQAVNPRLTTANVTELTNLYFTNVRTVAVVTPFLTTANVIESSSNLYFTNARAIAAFTGADLNVSNIIVNRIDANVVNISGNVTFGTGVGGTLTGLANLIVDNITTNTFTKSVTVIGDLRATGNLYANALILRNIDVTDTVVSGNISGAGTSVFNTLSANTITASQINVTSNAITVVSGLTGNPNDDAFFIVNRGTNVDVALKWSEAADRWQFTNDGNIYYNVPVPDEYSNVTYDVSVQTGTDSRSANLRLQGTRVGNVVVTDIVEVIGSGLVNVQRTSADKITINAGIAPVSILGVNNASYVEITRFDINTYRTAKYIYTATTTAYISGGPHFASGEILVMQDGANIFESQYGMVLSGHDEIVTFQTSINNGNVILSAKTTDSGTIATVKLAGTTYTEV